ncbi:unnamed protein product [Rotaria magnacalcarata]|uniref:Protein tweety homolog n=2 Tax=Rotaria magnacalcarata TaxID=392030 RepID=A0A819F436_9BILA|nr:unnamed protein product [Rotaria magnacalcarata]CAF3861645.1 unnamed protein product [Rotaria magnacalcarata]
MDLVLTCLNISSSLPTIPIIDSLTNTPSHSYYNPNGKPIFQLISSSLTQSTFSIADVRSFLELFTSNDSHSFDTSAIIKLKPVTSTIVYTSVALALFIVLSVIFCIISCRNCCKREHNERNNRQRNKKCSKKSCYIVFILLIGAIVIGQMIFLAYQVSRAKVFLDDSIKEVNQEIYPKEISIHLEHLLQQLEKLDQYSTQTDSIIIKASQSLFVKAFDTILREEYVFDEIRRSVNCSEVHINELEELITPESNSLPAVMTAFQNIKNSNREMINDLKMPLQEPCDYANGQDAEIISIIINSLDLVHQQTRKFIDTIHDDILSHITPWQSAMIFNQDLEDQIRWYISLVLTILLVLIIVLGIIPIIALIIIFVCRMCCKQQRAASPKYHANSHRTKDYGRQRSSSIDDDKNWISTSQSSHCSSSARLCWMRIVFTPMVIILILIVLVTGIFHGVDLFAQGACRTAHNDQPFLVSFFIDQLSGNNPNHLVINELDPQTLFTNIIDDCSNLVHFSEYFFQHHLIRLENDTEYAMNRLNKKVYDQFIIAIDHIKIGSHLDLLANFSGAIASAEIKEKVHEIEENLKNVEILFNKILTMTPILPTRIVNQTNQDFKDYLKRVLNSTIDMCPLPLATIYKTDTMLCHNFASSFNGLWFGLFLYMFFITFGLCICGLCIYKRL